MAADPLTIALVSAGSSIAGSLLTIFLSPRLQHRFWKNERREELRLEIVKEFNRLSAEHQISSSSAPAPFAIRPTKEWIALGANISALFSNLTFEAFKKMEVAETIGAFTEARVAALRAMYREVIRSPSAANERVNLMAIEKSRDPGQTSSSAPHEDELYLEQRKDYFEGVMNQRFHYFLIFYSLVVAGAVSARSRPLAALILSFGALVCFAAWTTIARAYFRHRYYKKKLNQEVSNDDLLRRSGPSCPWVRRVLKKIDCVLAGQTRVVVIPYVIPPLCILALAAGAVAIIAKCIDFP